MAFFFLFQVVKLGEFSIDFLGKHIRIYFAMEKNPLQDFSGQHDDMTHIFLKVARLRDEIFHLPQLHPGGVGASHTYKYLEPK